MSRAQFTVAISTDEEAAASKRMVLYAFSAQINLLTSFFLKQPLRNTVFILYPFIDTCSATLNTLSSMTNQTASLPLVVLFVIGNRTEWSPIRSVIIRAITKSDDRAAGVRFVYHEYDYRPNWTTRNPITN